MLLPWTPFSSLNSNGRTDTSAIMLLYAIHSAHLRTSHAKCTDQNAIKQNTIHNYSGTNSYRTNRVWYLILILFYVLFYCILISAFRWLKYEIWRHLLLISAAILVASHQQTVQAVRYY